MSKLARIIALAVGLVTSAGQVALSQSAGAVKVVVPFPAGGGNDALARVVAEKMSRMLGRQVVPGDTGLEDE